MTERTDLWGDNLQLSGLALLFDFEGEACDEVSSYSSLCFFDGIGFSSGSRLVNQFSMK